MSSVPKELRYTSSHEWVREEEDNIVTVGITNHAQELLGDVVFVELPELNAEISAKDEIAVVESVKAASDIYSPVSGEVVKVNELLEDSPETINADSYGDGWIFKVRLSDKSELDGLLKADAYTEIAEADDH